MKILIACSEAAPYIKTGGLADVAGALLKELRKKNEKAFLVLPLYAAIRRNFKLVVTGKSILVRMGYSAYRGNIFASSSDGHPDAYFIECDELYDRPELYGTSAGDYADNAIRFIFFSKAVLELCIAMRIRPDVIHCNDWQTALIPLYLKSVYKSNAYLAKTVSIFTVHNLGYQGIFDAATLNYTGLGREYFVPDRLEFYGKLNLMKAGLIYSDILNTVSNTYSLEIQQPEFGFGLEGVIKKRTNDLYGIINGIDFEELGPSKDPFLPCKYSHDDLKGKAKCRQVLFQKAAFQEEALPSMAVISRLSSQKGIDLVLNSLDSLIALGVNLIVLGKGEDYYESFFKKAFRSFKGRFYAHVGFDEALARLIYAGSDFFLMPSQYEPCGLGQLIAMKYGTVPIARKTGGLADTIQDYDHLRHTGTGFLFSDFTTDALQNAVKRAICVFTDKTNMNKIAREDMKHNYSWDKSTDKYLALYRLARKKVSK